MDAEIEQLLKSLNIEGVSAENLPPEVPFVSIPPVFHHQPCVPPKKRRRRPWLLIGGISISLIVGISCGLFLTKGVWWGVPLRIVHVYESAVPSQMTPPFAPAVQRMDPWATNDLSSHLLPSGDLSEGSSFAGHIDILKAAGGRRKALEEVRHDVDMLMANCIHSPDMASREALHRAVARFDVADVNLTHSLIPLILSKRSSLTTPQDQQKFNETLAFAGLGRGLEEYSKTVVQIAATKEFIEQFVTKLRDGRDLCGLAEMLESALQLFTGLRSDSLMPSCIDLDTKQKEAVENCHHSVQETLQKFPSTTYPRRCSLAEHKAVAFLQGQFPTIDPALFAKVDGFLALQGGSSHLRAFSENDLGTDDFSYSTMKMFMAPEGLVD